MSGAGRYLECLLLVASIAGVAAVGRGTRLQAAEVDSESNFPVLNLRLSAVDNLPQLTKVALQREVESIWRDGHVRLHWFGGKGKGGPTPALTILVTSKAVASCCTDGPSWTVGELLRFEGMTAIAVASIAGAQRVVEEDQQARIFDLPAFHDHRLGVVLGRAVAHEIGHYVLQTNTHAEYGLMRANISALEFADLRADSFRLDRAAAAYLELVASRGNVLDGIGREAFSYSAP